MTDLESFTSEIRKSGVTPEGVTLCNCEVSGEQQGAAYLKKNTYF